MHTCNEMIKMKWTVSNIKSWKQQMYKNTQNTLNSKITLIKVGDIIFYDQPCQKWSNWLYLFFCLFVFGDVAITTTATENCDTFWKYTSATNVHVYFCNGPRSTICFKIYTCIILAIHIGIFFLKIGMKCILICFHKLPLCATFGFTASCRCLKQSTEQNILKAAPLSLFASSPIGWRGGVGGWRGRVVVVFVVAAPGFTPSPCVADESRCNTRNNDTNARVCRATWFSVPATLPEVSPWSQRSSLWYSINCCRSAQNPSSALNDFQDIKAFMLLFYVLIYCEIKSIMRKRHFSCSMLLQEYMEVTV